MTRPAPKNQWTVFPSPICEWDITLPCRALTAERLLEWQAEAAATLESTGVFRVRRTPALDSGVAESMGSGYLAWAMAYYQNTGVVDLFYAYDDSEFSSVGLVAASELVYYDLEGCPASTWCADVSELNRRFGEAKAEPPWLDTTKPTRPLTIRGVQYHEQTKALWRGVVGPVSDPSIRMSMSTSTDIWVPWILPRWEHQLARETHGKIDNRDIAELNGRRLSAAVARLCDSVRRLGGTWKLSDETPSAFELGFREDGIEMC